MLSRGKCNGEVWELRSCHSVCVWGLKASILCLSRQNLPQLEGSTVEHAIGGGYCLVDFEGADVTLAPGENEGAFLTFLTMSEMKESWILEGGRFMRGGF